MSRRENAVKWWFLTWNNPVIPLDETLARIKMAEHCDYVRGQMERGESGTTHVQAVAHFSVKKRLEWLTRNIVLRGAHWEKCISPKDAITYVAKEETRLQEPIELGERPLDRADKKDWTKIWNAAKES